MQKREKLFAVLYLGGYEIYTENAFRIYLIRQLDNAVENVKEDRMKLDVRVFDVTDKDWLYVTFIDFEECGCGIFAGADLVASDKTKNTPEEEVFFRCPDGIWRVYAADALCKSSFDKNAWRIAPTNRKTHI